MFEEELSETTNQQQPNKGCTPGCLTTVVIFVVFIVIMVAIGSCNNDSTDTDSGPDKVTFISYAQIDAKSKLKSPSTAEFAPFREWTVSESDGIVTVRGYVDAENSYGVMLRNNIVAKYNATSKTLIGIDIS